MIEEADAWFEYLEATRAQSKSRYAEVEPGPGPASPSGCAPSARAARGCAPPPRSARSSVRSVRRCIRDGC